MNTIWDISLEHLTLGYGDNIVLRDISAQLPAGKISVVLGGSGCGKSTLLRHIIGLSKPMRGEVLIGGQDLFSLPDKEFRKIRRRMGVLFQDGALLGSLTVAENVALPLTEHTRLSKSIVKEIVMHKLALVNLADFADFYPSELSGGMRKRAGLARAIVTDPPILFCDEPTSGLDPISAAQMDELLLSMQKRFPSMTTIVVTHDMASVMNIAERVLILHNKGIVFSGTLDAMKQSGDPYLRQFLERKAVREQNAHAELLVLNEAIRQQMHDALQNQ